MRWQSKLNQWVDSDFKMTIYPTITTLVDYNDKLKEIDALKLKTVCVFLTGLNYKERKELLNKIQKTSIKERFPLFT